MIQFADEQGMLPRPLGVEELFAENTRERETGVPPRGASDVTVRWRDWGLCVAIRHEIGHRSGISAAQSNSFSFCRMG